jgi:hypothetical protein
MNDQLQKTTSGRAESCPNLSAPGADFTTVRNVEDFGGLVNCVFSRQTYNLSVCDEKNCAAGS